MKGFVLCLLLALALGRTINDEDLITFLTGYYKEWKFTKDTNKLIKCIDKSIGVTWEAAFAEITQLNWEEESDLVLGFSILIVPSIDSLGMVVACAKGELEETFQSIQKAIKDPKTFLRKIIENIDTIQQTMPDLIEKWKKGEYGPAGETIGALLNFIFQYAN